jgi:guanylate kinase
MEHDQRTGERVTEGKIFVFSAASGGGKTTLLDYVRSVFPQFVYSISVTTRSPRPGEIHGRHYFFISQEEFKKKIDAHEFAEWASVHGHFYGTPRAFIDDTIASGRHIIMDIDVFGKIKFDAIYPQAIGILLLPPSLDVLEKRLRHRNTENEQTIRVRLANARKEMDFARSNGKYEYTVINEDLSKTKAEIISILRNAITPSVCQA